MTTLFAYNWLIKGEYFIGQLIIDHSLRYLNTLHTIILPKILSIIVTKLVVLHVVLLLAHIVIKLLWLIIMIPRIENILRYLHWLPLRNIT